MKIFKLIAGIFILFLVVTASIVFMVMAVQVPGEGAMTFLDALLFVTKLYGALAIAAGVSGLVWFALHLISSALHNGYK
jgi:hypothetical protein